MSSTPLGFAGRKIVLLPSLSAKLFNVSKYWFVNRIDMICSSVSSTLAPFNSWIESASPSTIALRCSAIPTPCRRSYSASASAAVTILILSASASSCAATLLR